MPTQVEKGTEVFAAAGLVEINLGPLKQMPALGGRARLWAVSSVAPPVTRATLQVGDRVGLRRGTISAAAVAGRIQLDQDQVAEMVGLPGEAISLTLEATAAATVNWMLEVTY